MPEKNKDKAFTLIELLIVTATLAVISLAVYVTFAGGLKILDRISYSVPEEDVEIFFEKFAQDVRNGLNYKRAGFAGGEDGFWLSSLVLDGELKAKSVAKVKYLYDDGKKEIMRSCATLSDIYQDQDGRSRVMLKGVKSVKFQYQVYDKGRKEYLWQDGYEGEALPSAVRMELDLEANGNIAHFQKTENCPAGN